MQKFCKEDEITCHMESKDCQKWSNQKSTEVFIYIRFPKSIFLEHLKKLNYECKCKEYLFDCSIKSKTLIKFIEHNITHLTSTVSTPSPKTTSETTLPVTSALLSISPATDLATTASKHEDKPGPPAAAYKEENQDTYISSIAIVAALVGGVILGAGVEFVVILLMRRKTKSTDESQRDVTEKSMDNPAYTDSKTETTPEEYYTQITNQNSVYQNEIPDKDATYDHKQYNKSTQETYEQSTYNHLHERMEIESSNFYHHPRMVPNELSATELGYGIVKQSQINHKNAYTEVIAGEGEHHEYKGEDENRTYSVLEEKNL
uniref:Uncharacterized protein LOC111106569 isoform X2 n=1 Tax=Crassostrea virginica TaxID=6565 RepID=A0A8B8B1U6_CRAVI|nr:uncharacterized protein LOC111106569 isoform X2 [Crassostrea virginica]